MLAALEELGDDLANQAPPLKGANAPWAIVYHCAQVVEYWIGHLIAGRASQRDRNAEFGAQGTIVELAAQIHAQRRRLRDDLAGFGPGTRLAATPPADYQGPPRALTPVGVLLHVLEELAQHHGQVEVSRDLLAGKAADL